MSIDRVSDRELVERARGGDAAAFGELVERHQQAVVRAALAVLGDPADAEDVAQDAFVLAFRRLESFRGDASFKTWVLTIAWHEALNRRRSLVRRLARLVRLDDLVDPPAARAHDVILERTEHASHIRRLVRALPRRYRDALLLAATGECTVEDMAAVLGVPAGTVKWRVHRARAMLRAQLRELGYEA